MSSVQRDAFCFQNASLKNLLKGVLFVLWSGKTNHPVDAKPIGKGAEIVPPKGICEGHTNFSAGREDEIASCEFPCGGGPGRGGPPGTAKKI